MSTRSLTIVSFSDEIKVAQYGRSDGHPNTEGKSILDFLRKVDINSFKDKLKQVSFFGSREEAEIEVNKSTYYERPWLRLDFGFEILEAIAFDRVMVDCVPRRARLKCSVDKLVDSSHFAGDSLSCEWGYIIDLDKGTFEIFKGFNRYPLENGERFKHLPPSEGFHPLRHFKTYSLQHLPTKRGYTKDLKSMLVDE